MTFSKRLVRSYKAWSQWVQLIKKCNLNTLVPTQFNFGSIFYNADSHQTLSRHKNSAEDSHSTFIWFSANFEMTHKDSQHTFSWFTDDSAESQLNVFQIFFGWTWFFVQFELNFTACVACKFQIWRRRFFFSNLIFQKPSADR